MDKALYRRLSLKQNGRCPWCGEPLSLDIVNKEHIWPLSMGGANDEGNVALAHTVCNRKRSSNLDFPVHANIAFDFVRDIIRRVPR